MTHVWAAFACIVGGLWFGRQFVRGVRTGETAARSGPIVRARAPVFFFLIMAIHGVGGLFLPATGITILLVNGR